MRRLYSAVLVLAVLFGLMLWHIEAVERETELLVTWLQQAEQKADEGQTSQAVRLTEDAHTEWQRVDQWFGVVLRMGDTDEVDKAFRQTLEFLHAGEEPEYRSANAVLIEGLLHLAEVEQVQWGNIL
jgi:hypothetical protein